MDLAHDAPLDVLDRDVRRAVQATSAWEAQLAEEATPRAIAAQAPLGRFRGVAGKTAFDALGARALLPHDEALRAALRHWVGALTIARVTEDEQLDEAEAEAEASARVHREQVETTSFREAWRGLVRSRSVAEGGAWVDALALRGEAVAAARRERVARAEEAVRRLGFETRAALLGDVEPSGLDQAARTFLAGTRDVAQALRREAERRGGAEARAATFPAVVLEAMGRAAPEGWPARLVLRSLVATLGAPEDIGAGLRVDVRMPEALGAASFARALERFGIAYRRAAAAASTLPFAVAVAPSFVDAYRFGFVFGALPSQIAYQRRGLGVGPATAKEQARTLAKTALVHARAIAAASLLARSGRTDRAQFEELTHDVYGEAVPSALAGAFPRDHGDAPARLQALLTTLSFLHDLRERFDEDWFRNPHAWRFLRARASGPARLGEEEEPKAAPVALARAFEEALG